LTPSVPPRAFPWVGGKGGLIAGADRVEWSRKNSFPTRIGFFSFTHLITRKSGLAPNDRLLTSGIHSVVVCPAASMGYATLINFSCDHW
jgi:hypothetical protein